MLRTLLTRLRRVGWVALLLLGSASAPAWAEVELRVMTLNAQWNGAWTHEDVAHVIAASGADVIGLQEYASSESIRTLAGLLGFHAVPEAEILSRHPVVSSEALGQGWSAGVAVIEIDGQRVAVVNQHLSSYPYAPHDLVSGRLDAEGAVAQEERVHGPELAEAMAAVALLRGQGLPVFLLGDFNAPSHLDWRPEDAETNRGHSVAWPMSLALLQMGMTDAYRRVHPEPSTHPGHTWSVHPESDVGKHDRIDFIYFAGAAIPTAARIVGEPGSPHTDLAFSPWETDHRAVLVRFRLTGSQAVGPPLLRSHKETVRAGAPLHFQGRLGAGALEIHGRGDFPHRAAPLLRLPPAADGRFVVDAARAGSAWPLAPGDYDAFLRSPEGPGSLAAVRFRVASGAELIPPGSLRAAWDADSVSLSWRNRAEPDHRVVLERRVNRGEWVQLAVLPPGTRVYRDATGIDLAAGHLYEYRVSAADESGASLPSAVVGATARPRLALGRDGEPALAGSVTLHFSGGRGRSDDWIALFAPGAKPTEDTALDWKYTNGTRSAGGSRTDGSVFFEDLTAGRYDAHLLCCGGYRSEASLSFEVGAADPPRLRLDKSSYHTGEPLRVAFDGAPGHPEDWIGIYRAGDDPATAWYRTWLYANGTQTAGGSHRESEVVFSTGLPAGRYVARFLRSGSYVSIATTPVFTVE